VRLPIADALRIVRESMQAGTSRTVTPLPHQSTASRTDKPSSSVQRLPSPQLSAPNQNIAFTKSGQYRDR
jgi:hypothetical protein